MPVEPTTFDLKPARGAITSGISILCLETRVPDQNGVSLLYIMLEIHHSGREPSKFQSSILNTISFRNYRFDSTVSVSKREHQLTFSGTVYGVLWVGRGLTDVHSTAVMVLYHVEGRSTGWQRPLEVVATPGLADRWCCCFDLPPPPPPPPPSPTPLQTKTSVPSPGGTVLHHSGHHSSDCR